MTTTREVPERTDVSSVRRFRVMRRFRNVVFRARSNEARVSHSPRLEIWKMVDVASTRYDEMIIIVDETNVCTKIPDDRIQRPSTLEEWYDSWRWLRGGRRRIEKILSDEEA